jgi:hypothetical protein
MLRQHERDGALPTKGRFLFYELEQMGVIPKKYRDSSGKAPMPRHPSASTSALVIFCVLKSFKAIRSIRAIARALTTIDIAGNISPLDVLNA